MSARRHPVRTYLKDLPANWRWVRDEMDDARRASRHLWPFVWRATMEEEIESECGDAARPSSPRRSETRQEARLPSGHPDVSAPSGRDT